MLFETNLFGFKCVVYQDRIEYRPMFGLGGIQTIPIKQIASVDMAVFGVQQITVETSGGQKYRIVVRLRDKKKLRDVILGLL